MFSKVLIGVFSLFFVLLFSQKAFHGKNKFGKHWGSHGYPCLFLAGFLLPTDMLIYLINIPTKNSPQHIAFPNFIKHIYLETLSF